jgi:hypothetical protein
MASSGAGLAILLGAALIIGAAAPSPTRGEKTLSVECSVAQDTIAHMLDGWPDAAIVQTAPFYPEREWLVGTNLTYGWSGEAPSVGLADELIRAKPRSALECPQAAAWVSRRSPPPTSGDKIQIGMPVVDGAGARAVVVISVSKGFLSGATLLHLLERRPGGWRVTSSKILSLS